MALVRIPLFPLEVVLFPGKSLPLHIFEPRYKLMIRECADEQRPFGVVLARESSVASVGCTAAIVQTLKQYDDGRTDILTVGQTPFRIEDVHDEKPYYEATVEFLDDDPRPGADSVTRNLRALFAKCYPLIHDDPAPELEDDPAVSLACRAADELSLDLAVVQELLEMRAEAERRAWLAERLEGALPQLERRKHVRSKAPGNGHGLG